jgi:hypothetical protein
MKYSHHDRIPVNGAPSDNHIGFQKSTTEALRRTSLQTTSQVLGPLFAVEKLMCVQRASPPEQKLSSRIGLRVLLATKIRLAH